MTAASPPDWRREFGLDGRRSPSFFSSAAELDRTAPQAHILRRAFKLDLLKLDGVLCAENTPLVYFREMNDPAPVDLAKLYRQFWNHGGAPILVLISPDKIHVYSGLCEPAAEAGREEGATGLVEEINRVATYLREFLISVESGAYFDRMSRSFNPKHRVDRHLLDNLKAAREKLDEISSQRLPPGVLDALLCRLVFTCYLFDRKVINTNDLLGHGHQEVSHLRDILAIKPRSEAIKSLYRLFESLGADFNGDLFSDDLAAESGSIAPGHIDILDRFFQGTIVRTGQRTFWPYDFGVIPIETISAIYEQFLKPKDHEAGAFYTPRFLAEVVLDSALDGMPSLLGKKFLDPACGSGIFLVGLFNRMAEEWSRAHPNASHEHRASELKRILLGSLFGVDKDETACRITAFSLYLAYLDQLSTPDIQELQEKGRALPRLIANSGQADANEGNIRCADFFADGEAFPIDVTLVVGNPPWGSMAGKGTPAGRWCKVHEKPIPDKQISAAFVCKATEHVSEEGRVCLVLPSGLLFHHGDTALEFQKKWLKHNTIERVLNLADFRWFLFGQAVHPAIVVNYRKTPPESLRNRIDYWAPKADWPATQAEMITIGPGDRTSLSLGEILQDLEGPDAPQVWKQRFWATPRDLRLIDRLSLYPRLRDHVRGPRDKESGKAWLMAVGFKPFREKDRPQTPGTLELPGKRFMRARSKALNLFLLEKDSDALPSEYVEVSRLIQNTDIFRAPHVLVEEGFTKVAYAEFDVSFRHALRGIHGPRADRDLLIFLAAYLRTSLAKFFLFHTSSSWGVARPKVHVDELGRVPFPRPEQLPNPNRAREIVAEVARIVTEATRRAGGEIVDRPGIISEATKAIEPLIEEYFDVLPIEKLVIEDTINVVLPSLQPTRKKMMVEIVKPSTQAQSTRQRNRVRLQPTRKKMTVETIKASEPDQRAKYRDRVCDMLNGWAKRGRFAVRGQVYGDPNLGLGMAVFEKVERSAASSPCASPPTDRDSPPLHGGRPRCAHAFRARGQRSESEQAETSETLAPQVSRMTDQASTYAITPCSSSPDAPTGRGRGG